MTHRTATTAAQLRLALSGGVGNHGGFMLQLKEGNVNALLARRLPNARRRPALDRPCAHLD
jgi:hypothetical protein